MKEQHALHSEVEQKIKLEKYVQNTLFFSKIMCWFYPKLLFSFLSYLVLYSARDKDACIRSGNIGAVVVAGS